MQEMVRGTLDVDKDTKIVVEWFRKDWYGTPELNVSAVGMMVEEKDMSRRRE
jgi:hypothetical protein